jgi:hypothetical protein
MEKASPCSREARRNWSLQRAGEKGAQPRVAIVPIGVSADHFADQWLVEAILIFALPERVIFKI